MRFLVSLIAWVALAGPAAGERVEDHVARVQRLEGERTKLVKTLAAEKQVYVAKTGEIAKLKAKASSWNRDRKLESLLSESKDLARALEKRQKSVRQVEGKIATEKKALIAAIDRELVNVSDDVRKGELLKKRAQVAGRKPAKKIKLADEAIDPLDEPEDLEYKAAALARSEAQLKEELARLDRRETYYRKQAKLQKSRSRADEQDLFRDEEAHRGGSGGSRTSGDGAAAESPPSPTADTEGFTTQGNPSETREDLGADPAVVLADVIDAGTVDELRRAERSGNPESRAKAAAHAKKDLAARLEKLKKRREEMQRRARELRSE